MSVLRAYLEAVHADHVRLGFRSGNWEACTPGAYARTAWHDDARAGRLRPAVVGGVPLITTVHPDPTPSAGREAHPRSSSRTRRGAALATQPA